MSFGLMNKTLVTGEDYQEVYQVPSNCIYARLELNLLNNDSEDTTVSIALTNGDEVTDVDLIENGLQINSNGGVYVRSDLTVSPGEKVFIKSTKSGLVVRVSGELLTEIN